MKPKKDKMLIIVDGYNLINKIPFLVEAKNESIELARERLIHVVGKHCDAQDKQGIIVFDGGHPKRSVASGNPTIIFSSKTETADTVIESIVYNLNDRKRAHVVTDDRIIANFIIGLGASVISSKTFQAEIRSSSLSIKEFTENESQPINRGINIKE